MSVVSVVLVLLVLVRVRLAMPAKRGKTPAPGRSKARSKACTSSEPPPPQRGAVQTKMDAYLNTLKLNRLPDETDSEPERETEEASIQEKEPKKEGSCSPSVSVAAQPSGPRARPPKRGGGAVQVEQPTAEKVKLKRERSSVPVATQAAPPGAEAAESRDESPSPTPGTSGEPLRRHKKKQQQAPPSTASHPATTQAAPPAVQPNTPRVDCPKPGPSGAPLRHHKTKPQPSPNTEPLRRSSRFSSRPKAALAAVPEDPFDSPSPEVSEDEGEAWSPTRQPLPSAADRYLCIGELVFILFCI